MQSPQTTSGTHRSGADSEEAAPAPGHDHWDPPKPCETPAQRGTSWYPKAVGSGKASLFPAGFLVPPGKVLGTGMDPVLALAPSQPSLPTWGRTAQYVVRHPGDQETPMETETIQVSSLRIKTAPNPQQQAGMRAPPAQQPHPMGGFPNFSDPGSQMPLGTAETDSPRCWGARSAGGAMAAALRLHHRVAKSPGPQPTCPRTTNSFHFAARASFVHYKGPPTTLSFPLPYFVLTCDRT